MRFREGSSEDLARARSMVRTWRDEHPQDTSAQLVADLGGQFKPGYGPVLGGVLAALELHGGEIVTASRSPAAACAGVPIPGFQPTAPPPPPPYRDGGRGDVRAPRPPGGRP
jgi:hypothetical protein